MRLHVNIDHVATLRNARGTTYPDPVLAAEACLRAGAHGITAHLREDRRHIRDADVFALRGLLRRTGHLFNLEMAATEEMRGIALEVRPECVTLVPERREERTTEGGLDARGQASMLGPYVKSLQDAGIKVSLFVAADRDQLQISKTLGCEQVELHTGEYAHAFGTPAAATELARLAEGARFAHEIGLEVAAGHGLTLANVPDLVKISEIVELNIGHAMIGDAIFLGIEGATKTMLAALGVAA